MKRLQILHQSHVAVGIIHVPHRPLYLLKATRGSMPSARALAPPGLQFLRPLLIRARKLGFVYHEAPVFTSSLMARGNSSISSRQDWSAALQTERSLAFISIACSAEFEGFFACRSSGRGHRKRSGSRACFCTPLGPFLASLMTAAFGFARPDQRSCHTVLAELAHVTHRAGARGFERITLDPQLDLIIVRAGDSGDQFSLILGNGMHIIPSRVFLAALVAARASQITQEFSIADQFDESCRHVPYSGSLLIFPT